MPEVALTEFSSDAFFENARRLGIESTELPALRSSLDLSESRITRARDILVERLADHEHTTDVVAFGSLARREMTGESDFDYLVVGYSLDPHPGSARRVLIVADELREILADPGEEPGAKPIRPPGGTGLFGRIISAPDIVERVGLEEDTNSSHTRRILLLEESVSLLDPAKHDSLITSIIDRYLADRVAGHDEVPRFLLNDLVRYWRTLTVDYQAKSVAGGTTYSLRYLKLIISRKLTFAASLAPLLGCQHLPRPQVRDYLVSSFKMPSLFRLLQLEPHLRDDKTRSALADCLRIADKFIEKLGSAEWRNNVALECRQPDPRKAPHFGTMRDLGKDLQGHLETIFLSDPVRPFTEKYMLF